MWGHAVQRRGGGHLEVLSCSGYGLRAALGVSGHAGRQRGETRGGLAVAWGWKDMVGSSSTHGTANKTLTYCRSRSTFAMISSRSENGSSGSQIPDSETHQTQTPGRRLTQDQDPGPPPGSTSTPRPRARGDGETRGQRLRGWPTTPYTHQGADNPDPGARRRVG